MLDMPGDFQWSDDMSTAITFLDDEHRLMIERYNEVVLDLHKQADMPKFVDDMYMLLANTEAHFQHEERVMRNIQYPSFSEHRDAHTQLTRDFKEFIHNIGVGFKDKDLPALTNYFRYWFMTHVRDHDIKLKRYIDRTE